ncbi:RNA polymerase sigma factor [Knoellia sp. LjRoot47]|uniref:RNA polymerase sigma factor n=1 Tax=Knoellia sp. LjRoot47 TaxID=3342330 RepID=UPI003ED16D27
MSDTQGGDLDAWLDAAMPKIYGLAYALTGERTAAEDLSQEALATVVRKWGRVSQAQSSTAYARQIVVNTFLSQKRKRWSREVVSDDVVQELGPASVDHADTVVTRDALLTALAGLPPRQRAAVTLRYFEDLPDAAIATAMGCSVSTVRSTIHHALAALRSGAAALDLKGVSS